jgi:hypothetical protein
MAWRTDRETAAGRGSRVPGARLERFSGRGKRGSVTRFLGVSYACCVSFAAAMRVSGSVTSVPCGYGYKNILSLSLFKKRGASALKFLYSCARRTLATVRDCRPVIHRPAAQAAFRRRRHHARRPPQGWPASGPRRGGWSGRAASLVDRRDTATRRSDLCHDRRSIAARGQRALATKSELKFNIP